mmetsp:Transcript_139148/g.444575  ORF Transcript_139148/g.444575 Transcript_139148/m.444575 type:complete len:269 (+) Transcript_139148:384-1190(+)
MITSAIMPHSLCANVRHGSQVSNLQRSRLARQITPCGKREGIPDRSAHHGTPRTHGADGCASRALRAANGSELGAPSRECSRVHAAQPSRRLCDPPPWSRRQRCRTCGDEVTKDGAANDEVVHCSGMVTLRVQPRMQRLHLAHRTVARHVLIVLPCILCKVRSAPEQAATKTLIRTIAEKGEDRLRGCSMKQSGLMHIALKLVRQACERLLQHISDSKTRYLDLPITDLLRDTLPLHRVAPPELGVLNAPRARQFELLVLALLHDISS